MRRPLGVFELAATLTDEYAPFNAVGVLQMDGCPPREALVAALAGLQQRHPLLRARIDKRRRGYHFACDVTPPLPLQFLPRADAQAWRRQVEVELVTAFDTARGPLLRVACLAGKDVTQPAELVLTLHHGIADAASAVNLLHELTAAATAGVSAPGGTPLPLLPPAEQLFPAPFNGAQGRLRKMAFMLHMGGAEFRYRWRTGRASRFTPAPGAQPHVLTIDLPPATTTALVRRTRERRLTINSALNAALLQSAVRHLPQQADKPLCYFVFPNLRPYLEPPVGREHLGSYASMMRFMVEPPGKSSFWALADRVAHQVDAASRRGEKFLFAMASPSVIQMMSRMHRFRMGSVALGYMGVPALERQYGSLGVTGFHAFVSNFDMGPEYTAQVTLLHGRLTWDIVTIDSEVDAATATRMAESIRTILEAAAHEGGPTP